MNVGYYLRWEKKISDIFTPGLCYMTSSNGDVTYLWVYCVIQTPLSNQACEIGFTCRMAEHAKRTPY